MNKKEFMLKIVLIFAALLIIIFISDLFWLKQSHPYISGYICNIITEFIGIIITVYFIQNIFDKFSAKEKRLEEYNKIIRYNKFISEVIKQYILYFNCVVQPIETRDVKTTFPKEFCIKDLCDLHKTSLLIVAPYMKSSIEIFYKQERSLRQLFIKLSDSVDFNYYPKLNEIIMKFIRISIQNDDIFSVLINNEKIMQSDGTKMIKIFEGMLCGDNIEQLYSDFKQNKLNANGIMPYFMLYDLLKEEQKIIEEYQTELGKISTEIGK